MGRRRRKRLSSGRARSATHLTKKESTSPARCPTHVHGGLGGHRHHRRRQLGPPRPSVRFASQPAVSRCQWQPTWHPTPNDACAALCAQAACFTFVLPTRALRPLRCSLDARTRVRGGGCARLRTLTRYLYPPGLNPARVKVCIASQKFLGKFASLIQPERVAGGLGWCNPVPARTDAALTTPSQTVAVAPW